MSLNSPEDMREMLFVWELAEYVLIVSLLSVPLGLFFSLIGVVNSYFVFLSFQNRYMAWLTSPVPRFLLQGMRYQFLILAKVVGSIFQSLSLS